MLSLRVIAKSVAEAGLVPVARFRARLTPGTQSRTVLAYHNVVLHGPTKACDASLHLGIDDFKRQLDLLEARFNVVPLPDLVQAVQAPDSRPLVSITFDDAYRGCIQHALPELADRGLPSTVFLAPGLIGQPGFWWDMVAAGSGRDLLEVQRARVLGEFRGRQSDILSSLSYSGTGDEALHPPTLEDIERLAESDLVSVASHSWSHPSLAALEKSEIREELALANDWIARHLPERALVEHLSLPYGLWNIEVLECCQAQGIRYVYLIEGGGIDGISGSSKRRGVSVIPRVNVPAGVTMRGFELRLRGVFN